MSALDIVQIPVLSDNYVYLVREPETETVGVVDPALARPVFDMLDVKGWQPTHVLNTHHHHDHVGGNKELKRRGGCSVIGPRADANRIPGIDVRVGDGDVFAFGRARVRVFDVPGHTRGHVAYWFEAEGALFCGDTLFALGCGRLFEGTPAQMWRSLGKFRALPPETRVYCAHEYTETNARFAVAVDPGNRRLKSRHEEIKALRAKGRPTVPSTIGLELETNPFLRADDPELAQALGMRGADAVSVFAEIRRRKDHF